MSEIKRHIDDLFRKELSDHEVLPPQDVWENISGRLFAKKRQHIIHNYIKVAAVIAVLLGFGGGLMHIFFTQEAGNYLSPSNRVPYPLPESEIIAIPSQPLLFEELKEPGLKKPVQSSYRATGNNQKIRDIQLLEALRKKEVEELFLLEPLAASTLCHTTYPEQSISLAKKPVTSLYTKPPQIKDDQKEKWAAGIMLSPNYSYRSLSSVNAGSLSKARYNNIESGMASLTGSISISYNINDKFSLQSGLNLLNMGQKIEGLQVFRNALTVQILKSHDNKGINKTAHPVYNSLGEIYTTSSSFYVTDNHNRIIAGLDNSTPTLIKMARAFEEGDISQQLFYLQAPLLLRYRINGGDTDIVVSGGFGVNFLAGNRVMLMHHGNPVNIGRTLNINSFSLSGVFGIGLERNLSDNISLNIEPRLNHFINPINSNSEFHSLPYAFSLYGGIYYRF